MPDVFVPPNNAQQPTASPQSTPSALPMLTGHRIHLFSSYSEAPQGMSFQSQLPNETILLFLRPDFITNIPWIIGAILLIIIPTLIMILFRITNIPVLPLPPNFAIILTGFYYLLVAAYVFVNFITWYYNISLITTERVLDVDFRDLIYTNVAETKLTLVQDVSYTQVGVIRAIFDYGDVLIQTAAAIDNFDLYAVPQPRRAVQVVEELIGKEEHAP